MDNIKKLEVYGIDFKNNIKFYYRKMKETNPEYPFKRGAIVTACVIKLPWYTDGNNTFARGIAICTPNDQFNRKLGRNIAMGRAVAAIEKKTSFNVIDVPFLIPEEFSRIILFSMYGTVEILTEFECSLFKNEVQNGRT